MSRRNRNQLNKAFSANPAPLTTHEVDEALYGAFATVDEGRMDAEPVSIFQVFPDATQPRRTIVSACRHLWDGTPDTVGDLFNGWLDFVINERYMMLPEEMDEAERQQRSSFDLLAYLQGDDDRIERDEYAPGPLEAGFMRVVALAASIRRDGLTNPITAARVGTAYRLETGERRWLAFHLLHWALPEEAERWQRIPARVVEQASVWRMANENNVRADLNAIGKARQFALLMMDLYSQRGQEFVSYDELVKPGGYDRKFYAQVWDGDKFPIPRGGTEKLLNAMGFTSRSQMSEHRALLMLPDQVWQWADDLNWAQRRIRDMTRAARRDGKLDRKLLIEIAEAEAARDGLSVGAPTPGKNPGIPNPYPALPGDGPHRYGKNLISRRNKAILRELMTLRSGVGEADVQTKREILEKIDNARHWLDTLEKSVGQVDEE